MRGSVCLVQIEVLVLESSISDSLTLGFTHEVATVNTPYVHTEIELVLLYRLDKECVY